MAHRKWKEIKQQPSMLPGPAVSGSCLASFHFLWAIHPIRPVQPNSLGTLRKHFTKPSEQVAAPPGSAASTDWRGACEFKDGAEQEDDKDPHCDAGYPSSDFQVVLLLKASTTELFIPLSLMSCHKNLSVAMAEKCKLSVQRCHRWISHQKLPRTACTSRITMHF